MMKNIRGIYFKRIICLIAALICFSSNFILIFASTLDKSNMTMDGFYDSLDNSSLLRIQFSGNGSTFSGDDINQDSTLTVEYENEKTFKFTNSNGNGTPMLTTITSGDGGPVGTSVDAYWQYEDGKYYHFSVINEELTIYDLKINENSEFTGSFEFVGVYDIMPYGDTSLMKQANVTFRGIIDSYSLGDDGDNVFLVLDYAADDNQCIIEVNGKEYEHGVTTEYIGIEEGLIDQFALIPEFVIENAEFGGLPIIANTESHIDDSEASDSPTDITLDEIVVEDNTNDLFVEESNNHDEINDDSKLVTPGKVVTAVALSVVGATTGSAAISTISGSISGQSFGVSMEDSTETLNTKDEVADGKEERKHADNENQEKEENSESTENKDSDYDFSIVINNGEPLPELCNTKGAAIQVPIHIVNGENIEWKYLLTAICPQKPKAVTGVVLKLDNSNSVYGAITINGIEFDEHSLPIYCTLIATAEIDNKKINLNSAFELKLHKCGLYAKVIDSNNGVSKDNLDVVFIRDSKVKGIADIVHLKSDEFDVDSNGDCHLR